MKTVSYSITNSDVMHVALPVGMAALEDSRKDFKEHPEWFGGRELNSLQTLWLDNAVAIAAFAVLKHDGLATIKKNPDAYYTFAEHEGDCFNPQVNTDIAPEELKRQRRREMARFNRQGVWYHTLEVLNEEHDSISGFIGNDFYGSGYDIEFYDIAFSLLAESEMAEYVRELLKRVREALSSSAQVLDS